MKLEINVPTTLAEITVGQYQRFARLEGDEEFLTHKMLEIFCGLPLADLPNVRVKDVSHVTRHINSMLGEKPKLTSIFKMGGVEYGFVPELDNMTYCEFTDLDLYLQDVQNLHKSMAVLYRPITERFGDRYDVEPYEGTDRSAERMKEAPMSVAMGAVLFFYRLGNELLQATLTYLEEGKWTNTQDKGSLLNDGDGMQHTINLLKEMCENLMTFPGWESTNASTT